MIDLFSNLQLQTILLTWIQPLLSPFLTGNISLDVLIISSIVSLITTIIKYLLDFFKSFLNRNSNIKGSITIQIEYNTFGPYHERHKNVLYESLSWLISQQSKKLTSGAFILKVTKNNNKQDFNIISNSSILPENNQSVIIEYNNNKFYIEYKIPENEQVNKNNYNNNSVTIITQENYPSIFISTVKNSKMNVESINKFLVEVLNFYIENKKKINGRFRYENSNSKWVQVQKLSASRGLDSIALDFEEEQLLKKELDTFINNKLFYENIGMPYKRGILLYGKPGTGKTSLINAISSHLFRDIYYLNLKMIKNDSELCALFSTVPSNQLLVLEDVDTQSSVIHKRNFLNYNNLLIKNENNNSNNDENKENVSLSTFLSCLDGHILSDGIIIIMTTNHINYLDPACIRPGRMDLHIELGYCTKYQIKKLFNIVFQNLNFSDDILIYFQENLIPPSEIMSLLTLYREDIDLKIITQKMNELIKKYQKRKLILLENKQEIKKRKLNSIEY